MSSSKTKKINFLNNYFKEFKSLISNDKETFNKLLKVSELMEKSQKRKKKL